jgi:hypothetical protein
VHALYAALEYDPEKVPRDEALQLIRKHVACTNGVRTKDRDFWTAEILMIPRKKCPFFLFSVKMIPITPRPII